MNVPQSFSPATDKVIESRKLLGLCIALAVVILLTAVFIICSTLFNTPWDPFGELLKWVSAITGTHQLSQGASDVSKWRSSAPASASSNP